MEDNHGPEHVRSGGQNKPVGARVRQTGVVLTNVRDELRPPFVRRWWQPVPAHQVA